MKELIDAIQANWQGYEELRALILKKGDFFGNDTDRSNYVAQKLYQSLYEFLKDKKCVWIFVAYIAERYKREWNGNNREENAIIQLGLETNDCKSIVCKYFGEDNLDFGYFGGCVELDRYYLNEGWRNS